MADELTPHVAERLARGKAYRQLCPRQDQATLSLPLGRDLLALLEASSKDRVPALVPVRYGRMLVSPFTFFRGLAMLQAADLAAAPSSGISLQICGDAHLLNFGFFASPERHLMFDLNDFDETYPAPWEWDLKRLLVSLVLAARQQDCSDEHAGDMVVNAVQTYQSHLFRYASMSTLDVWYERLTLNMLEEAAGDDPRLKRRLAKVAETARRRTSADLLPKITFETDGGLRLKDALPNVFHLHEHSSLLEHDDEWMEADHWEELIVPMFEQYLSTLQPDRRVLLERFRRVDLAFKVVGVGSVGTRCLVLLMQDEGDQPLFLQLKEARDSVLEPYVQSGRFAHGGERVVTGQRLMQAASDAFLGHCTSASGRHFYVRQLRDMKTSVPLESFDAEALEAYGRICARTLARAHARAGGQAAEMAGYIGRSDRFACLMRSYALAYSDQVEADYEDFCRAVQVGRLPVETAEDWQQRFTP